MQQYKQSDHRMLQNLILCGRAELTEADLGVAGLALTPEAAAGWEVTEASAALLASSTADRTRGPLRPR